MLVTSLSGAAPCERPCPSKFTLQKLAQTQAFSVSTGEQLKSHQRKCKEELTGSKGCSREITTKNHKLKN
jgi:hypothetical protein